MDSNKIIFENSISLIEAVVYIDTCVNNYFVENEETGEITYEPYIGDISEIESFFNTFIKGMEVDKEKSNIERLFYIIENKTFMKLYNDTILNNPFYSMIHSAIKKKVDYKRNVIFEKETDSFKKLTKVIIEKINDLSEMINKMNLDVSNENMAGAIKTLKDINGKVNADNLVKAYQNSGLFDDSRAKVLDSLNNKIVNLNEENEKLKRK